MDDQSAIFPFLGGSEEQHQFKFPKSRSNHRRTQYWKMENLALPHACLSERSEWSERYAHTYVAMRIMHMYTWCIITCMFICVCTCIHVSTSVFEAENVKEAEAEAACCFYKCLMVMLRKTPSGAPLISHAQPLPAPRPFAMRVMMSLRMNCLSVVSHKGESNVS